MANGERLRDNQQKDTATSIKSDQMHQIFIAAFSARRLAAKPVVLAVMLLGSLAGNTQGASIVHVTYHLNDQQVGAAIYTGSDGSAGSDPSKYWPLITGPPEIVPDGVTIESHRKNENVATLKGKIRISLTIRSSISMGIVELDSLRLVRDDTKSNGWYVPKDEYRRIHSIVKNHLKDTITVAYMKGYDQQALVIYTVPNNADPSRPATYWKVLGSAPPIVNRVNFKPDTPNGKTATLRDSITIELGPRPYVKLGGNARHPGQVKLDSLKLVRDRADSDKWRLPNDELQRVIGLVGGGEK